MARASTLSNVSPPHLLFALHAGTKSWSHVAGLMGRGRIGKQCRERWFNHLRPDITNAVWCVTRAIVSFAIH